MLSTYDKEASSFPFLSILPLSAVEVIPQNVNIVDL